MKTSATGPSCGGSSVGGYCWYYAAENQSCDSRCSDEGTACDLTGTRDYAGSGGTNANCVAVFDALGVGSGGITSNSGVSGTLGCVWHGSSSQRYRINTGTTNCSSSAGFLYRRLCACE